MLQKFIDIMLLSFRIGKTTFGVFKHLVRMNVSGLMYNYLRLASSVIQHLGNPIQRALKILLILIIKQILKLLCWLSDIISIILSFYGQQFEHVHTIWQKREIFWDLMWQ